MSRAPTPAKLPNLLTMIDNLGQPITALAKFLDISPSTMARYVKAGQAPRPVMLALYWETLWGQQAAYCDMHQSASLHAQDARYLREKVARLEQLIKEQQTMLDKMQNGAANAPFF